MLAKHTQNIRYLHYSQYIKCLQYTLKILDTYTMHSKY